MSRKNRATPHRPARTRHRHSPATWLSKAARRARRRPHDLRRLRPPRRDRSRRDSTASAPASSSVASSKSSSGSAHRIDASLRVLRARAAGASGSTSTTSTSSSSSGQIVRDQLRRIGGFEDPPVSADRRLRRAVGLPQPRALHGQARGEIGFVQRNTHRFLRIDHCVIATRRSTKSLPRLQGKGGGLHQVAIRRGVKTGEQLIHPDLSAVDQSVPSGQKYYHEELLGHRFRISGASFFQTNTPQAERLIELVRDRLDLQAGGDARGRLRRRRHLRRHPRAARRACHRHRGVRGCGRRRDGEHRELARTSSTTVARCEDVLPDAVSQRSTP